jgi:hypothetical protein
MELEEMKTLWGTMSEEIKKQKKLTDQLIIKMIHMNYKNKLQKIVIPETIGSLICLAGAGYIVGNFTLLDSPALLVCGLGSVLMLIVMPLLSLRAIWNFRSVDLSGNNYKQTMVDYAKAKTGFVFVQKLSYCLGALLLVFFLPVLVRLMGGKDPFSESKLWISYAVVFLFFAAFSRWVFRCYVKTANDAENILKELEG